MKIEILSSNDTRRQTGNQAWIAPNGYVSGKIARKALDLKGLIQRDMGINSIEMANRLCDALIADAETVAVLETAPLEGGIHG